MMTPAILASLLCGAIALASIAAALRLWNLHGRASARAAIWLMTLVALACVGPAFLAGSSTRTYQVVPVRAIARVVAPSTQLPVTPRVRDANVHRDTAFRLAFPDVRWIWLAGALAMFARTALGLVRLRMLVRSSETVGERRISRGAVRVICADLFDVPVAAGYRHPVVILPNRLRTEIGEDALENVILHELEHLARYDDVSSLVQALCLCVLWFNPFAYMIARRLTAEREMACDEAVVARTGKRRTYATMLLSLATHASPAVPAYLPALGPASKAVDRLTNLLDNVPAAPRARTLAAVMVAVAFQAAALAAAAATPRVIYGKESIAAYTRVELPHGQTLLVGGRNADGSPAAVAQLYDRAGRRVALVRTNVARFGASVTALRDGRVLVLGGIGEHGVTNAAEIFDPSSRRFTLVAPMPQARVGHTATLLADGRVLIANGERAPGAYVQATEIYDPATDTYERSIDGDARTNQIAILIDSGSVLIYGGAGERCALIYDPPLHRYRSAGSVVAVTPSSIVTRRRNASAVRHLIRS